jgi:hypothetical protein
MVVSNYPFRALGYLYARIKGEEMRVWPSASD